MRRMWLICAATLMLGACKDSDKDGTRDALDCRPDDPLIHPDAEEVCDGVDNNCSGQIDEGVALVAYWDRDGDGFGDDEAVRRVCTMPADGVEVGGDCDDLDPQIHPDAVELCNEADDDCDGETDEGVLEVFYQDADDDGHGVPTATTEACYTPPGYAPIDDDCDDGEPLAWTDAPERCDDVDNDCDGEVDEALDLVRHWEDLDGDGFGDPDKPVVACGEGGAVVDNALDCDDTDATVNPDAAEIVGNATDEDCDGYLDELGVGGNGAYATVEEALEAASPGDVVQLDGAFFTGSIDLRPYPGVTLAGEGCDRTTLYGDVAGSGVIAGDNTVENFAIAGGTGTRLEEGLLPYPDGSLVTSAITEYGGGILVDGNAVVRGMCISASSAAWGGGIAVVNGDDVLVEDTRLWGNIASVSGAGVFLGPNTTTVLRRIDVRANRLTGTGYGAGLDARGATWTLSASVLAGNEAGASGAALSTGSYYAQISDPKDTKWLLVPTGEALVEHTTFHANHVVEDTSAVNRKGIAILARGGDLTLRDVVFSGHDDDGQLLRAAASPGAASVYGADPDGGLVVTEFDDNGDGVVDRTTEFPSGIESTFVWGGGVWFDRQVARDLPPEGEDTAFGAWAMEREAGDPAYVLVDPALDPTAWDLHLMPGSDLIDAATGGTDPDGSPADVGAYGGPDAPDDAAWPSTLDSDGDGMLDAYEIRHGLNPWVDDAGLDPDGDGADNGEESGLGTDPTVADTDGDGIDDPNDPAPLQRASHAPAAVAPHRVWGIPGEPVVLDGSLSGDPQGDALTYAWTILSAPSTSALVDVDAPSAAVSALTADVAGTYELALTVSDGAGTDTVTVTARIADAVVVPDDAATLQEAIDQTTASKGVALRPGRYLGPVISGTEDLLLFGLGDPAEVIVDGDGVGPVITLDDGDDGTVANLTITGGDGSAEGGGLLCDGSDRVEIYGVTFHRNAARSQGGGAWCDAESLSIVDSRFLDNEAPEGAGLYVQPDIALLDLDIVRTVFVGNQALRSGGGLYYRADSLPPADPDTLLASVRNSVFAHNTAQRGAALLQDEASLTEGSPQTSNLDLFHSAVAYNRAPLLDALLPATVLHFDEGQVVTVSLGLGLNWSDDGIVYASDLLQGGDAILYAHALARGADQGDIYHDDLDTTSEAPLLTDVPYGDVFGDELIAFGPRLGSASVDAGFFGFVDLDGSPADIGVCGGPEAPRVCRRWAMDADGDGMSDGWELYQGLDPSVDDGSDDPDGDGVVNLDEHDLGTSPWLADTDHDGRTDAGERFSGTDAIDNNGELPTADAGASLIVEAGGIASITGLLSDDPVGAGLAYAWSLAKTPIGSTLGPADLTGADTAFLTFLPDVPGQYIVELQVTDADGASDTDWVRVNAAGTLAVPADHPTVAAAVAAAREGDTIDIGPGTWPVALDLEGRQLTFLGAGIDQTVLTGDGLGSAVKLSDAANLTFRDLAIEGVMGDDGGAIDCSVATLRLERVRLADNIGPRGGGVDLSLCDATFVDVDVLDNIVANEGGAVLASESTLVWTGGRVARNRADTGAGGLYVSQDSDVTVTNVVFDRNWVLSSGSASAMKVSGSIADIAYNTFVGNLGGDGALTASGTGADVKASHNLFVGNEGCAVYEATSAPPFLIVASRGGFWLNECDSEPRIHSTGLLQFKDDPRFVALDLGGDGDSDDLRLRNGSPAIDAGVPSDPDGSDSDFGAFGGPSAPAGFDGYYADTDGDGLSDGWELAYGFDPTTPDSAGDRDGDGLSDLEEHDAGTDPTVPDSDADGVSDGDEVLAGADPLLATDHAPTVDAGVDVEAADLGVELMLDASASDPFGAPLTLAWRLLEAPGGSALTDADLQGATSSTVRFTPDRGGRYVLELEADNGSATGRDSVSVIVGGDLDVPGDYGSVDEALDLLLDGFTLSVGPGTWPTNSVVRRSVQVVGAGPEQTVLDGGFRDPILVITVDAETVALEGLTLAQGLNGEGGALKVGSNVVLTLDDVHLRDNIAVTGGAVYLQTGAELYLSRSRVVDNGATAQGAGIYAYINSIADLEQVQMAGNLALDHGGAVYMRDANLAWRNGLCADNYAGLGGGCIYTLGVDLSIPRTVDVSHVTAVWNQSAAGSFWWGGSTSLGVNVFRDLIVVDHEGSAFYTKNTLVQLDMAWSAVDNPTSFDIHPALPTDGMSIDRGTPVFVAATDDLDWTNDDFHLDPTDLLATDAGDPTGSLDPDGSAPDLGAFGGALGDWSP